MSFRTLWIRSRAAVIGSSLVLGMGAPRAEAEPMREFIMSCSYGVLAGTLVGAATLAFSEKPGDSLNKVARGASYGLYAGILLGLYVVYGVPSAEEDRIRDELGGMQPPMYQSPSPVAKLERRSETIASRFLLAPVFSERGSLDGAEVFYKVATF